MECGNQNLLQSQMGVTTKKDLVVNASSCMKVLENLLNSPAVLNTHISISRVETKDSGKEPWSCPICFTPYTCKESLSEHIQLYHMKGNVPCNKCSRTFPTSRLLREHMMKDHSVSYDKCPFCGMLVTLKDNASNSSYESHMSVCNRNPKNVISSSVMSNVQKTVQNNPNYPNDKSLPLKCSKCSLEFDDKEALNAHVCITLNSVEHLFHSKVNSCNNNNKNSLTFKCTKCCLEFEDKESIENHICITLNSIENLLNHKSDNRKDKNPLIWKCLFCTLPFEDKESFEKHECLSPTSVENEKVENISSTISCNKSSFPLQEPNAGISENFKSPNTCSQSYNKFVTSSPVINREVIDSDNMSEKDEDSVSVQINSVFSLTQDEWQNHSEIISEEKIGNNICENPVPEDKQNEAPKSSSYSVPIPSEDTLCISSSSTLQKEDKCKLKISNVSSKYSEIRQQIRQSFCKMNKGYNKNESNVQIDNEKYMENEQHIKPHDEKEKKEGSLQNDKTNDFSDMEVNVTCGMCKSDFTKFNHFRFHYSLCKMVHLSTFDGTEDKQSYDALCNLCLRTFPVMTDYVIHLKTCKTDADNETSQKKSGVASDTSAQHLPFSNSLYSILTNCAIMLLRGSDWQCIKCNRYLSSLPSAVAHYNNCKNPPFSSDTSSFANYIRLICTRCEEVFKEVNDFESHKEHCILPITPPNNHNEIDSISQNSICENKAASSPVKKWCPRCGHCFRDKKHSCKKMLQHMQSCFVPLKQLKTMKWSLYNKIDGRKCKYQCKECNKSFTERQDYMHHIEDHVPSNERNTSKKNANSQEFCHINSSTQSEVEDEKQNMQNPVQKSNKTFWKCKSCQVIYTSLSALKQHVLSVHDKKLRCIENPSVQLTSSTALCTSDKASLSINSSKVCNTPTLTDEQVFKCMACNFKFTSDFELGEHLKIFHPVSAPLINNLDHTGNNLTPNNPHMLPPPVVDMSSRFWKCNTCFLSCTSPSALRNHQSLHQYACSCGLIMNHIQASAHDKLTHGTHKIICNNLPLYKNIPPLGQGYLKCRMCFTDFNSESDLLKHTQLFPHCADNCFEPNIKCSLCNVQFSNKDLYLKHLSVHHKYSTTHHPNNLGQKWAPNPIQSLIDNVVESELLPPVLQRTPVNSQHNASAAVEVNKPLLQPSKQLECLPSAECLTRGDTKVSKHDGWMVLSNTNSEGSTSHSSQILNYVCSRCYRSQPTLESLSLHIKEDHKVHLPGDLNLGTIRARKT